MKLNTKVKLLTTPEQFNLLHETLRRCNECCNWLSGISHARNIFRPFGLQKAVYHQAREQFGLTANLTVRCINKVCGSYAISKNKARRKFRGFGAINYDPKILRWFVESQAISIWTLGGRLVIPFACSQKQIEKLTNQNGECTLLLEGGAFYLRAIYNVAESPTIEPVDVIGFDVGVVKIASDSDGTQYSGSAVNSVRYRHRRLRTKLQKKQTRSAKRRLRQLSGREKRFSRDVNHCISKQIVANAERTKRAIAIEDLKGIRSRIRARREQRAVLHSWSFFQLREYIAYKSALAGVPLYLVDPRNSSRQCSICGHTEKANRPSQDRFRCRQCGFTANADINAAVNLRERGRALTHAPYVSDCGSSSHDLVTS